MSEFDIPFKSDIMPTMLEGSSKLKFECHKGVSCFNACCKKADITLTPYDIIRLKHRLNMDSTEFLKQHAVPFRMDGEGMTGVKMRTSDEGQCLFNSEDGCSVYDDRPTSCRYYPVAHMALRHKDSPTDETKWALIKEEHCKGHEEAQELTVDEYRADQKVEVFDEMNREWMQIILKRKSAGPSVGKPSEMSLQLFFMCSFDMDRFRRFAVSDAFKKTYILDDSVYEEIAEDDIALMKFGSRLMRQVLFGERTIDEVKNIAETRAEERKEVIDMRRQYEIEKAKKAIDDKYKEGGDS